MKSAHTSYTLQTHGWDEATEQDVELPSVFVAVWVRGIGSACIRLELECKTPEELWHFTRAMNRDRERTLLQTFNYTEPKRTTSHGLPTNLGDLF